jgi:hypothetical protein
MTRPQPVALCSMFYVQYAWFTKIWHALIALACDQQVAGLLHACDDGVARLLGTVQLAVVPVPNACIHASRHQALGSCVSMLLFRTCRLRACSSS